MVKWTNSGFVHGGGPGVWAWVRGLRGRSVTIMVNGQMWVRGHGGGPGVWGGGPRGSVDVP